MNSANSPASGHDRTLSIICPVYENQPSLAILFKQLQNFEARLAEKSVGLELIFVDDGSKDGSYGELLKIHDARPASKIIKLTRNFGAVPATRTGMRFASGDAMTLLAADLQAPLDKVEEMLDLWLDGQRFVICVRAKRGDTMATRFLANIYYRLVKWLAFPEYPIDGFDLMLMDEPIWRNVLASNRNASPQLAAYWQGFTPSVIEYERPPRPYGRSRWTLAKRLGLLIDTVISFSTFPIRILSLIGAMAAVMGFLYGGYIFANALLGRFEVAGFATLAVLIAILNGVILLLLGIIGGYIHRLADSICGWPDFVVEESTPESEESR